MTKVLRLSALAPVALALLAKDKIGMDAAQALTLTDDHERQIEALDRCGNSGHAIRRMLTEAKIGMSHHLFRFVGGDAYAAAGGTITRDLFAAEGDGYADDPALVVTLAEAKLDGIAASYRAEGWQDVRASLERPDDYYSLTMLYASGTREPNEPVILKAMAEALGATAADNCAKMKKGELAATAAERMADKGWLPPALEIAEPPAEVAVAPSFDNDDEAEDFGEDEGAFEEEPA